jgi:hypothetical protein
MSLITVLRPDNPQSGSVGSEEEASLAPRAPLPEGAVLTLVVNGKSSADRVLEMIAAGLRRRLPQIAEVDVVQKESAAKALSDAEAERIAARSNLAVAGLGDCGACSSCSTLDAVALEKLGVPSTVVITEPFVGLIDRFATMAGMPGYHSIVLPHPVAARSDEELRGLIDGLADDLVAQLTEAGTRERSFAGSR